MQFSVSRHAECHKGSFFHPDYALRVTRRCLEEDLATDATTPFEDIRDHPIIKAFVKDRATDPDGGKTVGPEAGEKTLRRVGYGDDHRGVTWWDPEHKVVWLCAYHGKHRSGDSDDSFPYFEELREAGRIYPTTDDYELLFEEEDAYFFDFVEQDAQESLEVARQHPDQEIEVEIGRKVGTSIVVELVETMEETYVAFSWEQIHDLDTPLTLLQAFYPGSRWEDWQTDKPLPTRPLNDGEVCFSHFHG